ncbi:MAG: MBL fold metallo-hydrolase [Candidatus Lernaella stagnicola]|nr:MBL fold metallo-hydrolase [Candidatus Lernaella stagnicola]
MQLEFHGAIRVVTGSCYLLRIGGKQVLIDCGLYQGGRRIERRNREAFHFNPQTIDAVVVTHAHIDHIGLLPKLVRDGYRGPIHSTAATSDLARILLLDAAHIAEFEAERHNRKAKRSGQPFERPVFTMRNAEDAIELFVQHRYGDEFDVVEGLHAVYRDAGHILGSAFVEMVAYENGAKRRITFSGDLGNTDQAIICDPQPPNPTDVLLIESTYGDRQHRPRGDTLNELAEILLQAYKEGGNVVIPAFAVGRTQEVLYRLREMNDEGRLPAFNVFVDSPLAISATQIVRENSQCYDDETVHELTALGSDPLMVPRLAFTRSTDASKQINFVDEPSIIISASGMCNAGRILHHLKHNLWRREAHVVFVGYQGVGTLGRLLVDGIPRVKIMGDEIMVAAHIHTIGGLSAHADQQGMMDWAKPLADKPPRTFVVHGEEGPANTFAKLLKSQYGFNARVPLWHETVTL